MAIFNLSTFLSLSASLNYQLTTPELGSGNLLAIIIGRKKISEENQRLLLRVLEYLRKAYGPKRRRVGPHAVLHPLRATAMLARAETRLNLLDLLSELLHDKFEDILPGDRPPQVWEELETEFRSLIKQVDPTDEWYLMERLEMLTRGESERYNEYIGRLVERARMTPELIRVKLADRLDNTLDMHVEPEDPLENTDFFAYLFQILFVRDFQGYKPLMPHPQFVPFYGARRLHELYKNTVVLSLVRQKHDLPIDTTGKLLLEELAAASMAEAQRMILHIFGYHHPEVSRQRTLLLGIVTSLWNQRNETFTLEKAEGRLHDLFVENLDHPDHERRMERLNRLYQDKQRMVEAAMFFIIVFLNFLHDRDYDMGCITPGRDHTGERQTKSPTLLEIAQDPRGLRHRASRPGPRSP